MRVPCARIPVSSRNSGGFNRWESIIFVTCSQDYWHEYHAKILESVLIGYAADAPDIILTNRKIPRHNKWKINAIDLAFLSEFLFNLSFVLRSKGLDLVDDCPTKECINSDDSLLYEEVTFVLTHHKGAKAKAQEREKVFTVEKGSIALNCGYVGINKGYERTRIELQKTGILAQTRENEELLIFTADYTFWSHHQAAAIILGRNASGDKEWIVQDTNLNYGEWQLN